MVCVSVKPAVGSAPAERNGAFRGTGIGKPSPPKRFLRVLANNLQLSVGKLSVLIPKVLWVLWSPTSGGCTGPSEHLLNQCLARFSWRSLMVRGTSGQTRY